MAEQSAHAAPSMPWQSAIGRMLSFGLALAAIVAISAYCFLALTETRRAGDFVARAQEMVVQLRDLGDAGRELGDAARQYLASGEERHLQQHRAAMAKARTAAEAVGRLSQDDATQRERWQALERSIMLGLSAIERMVERRAAGGEAIALPVTSGESVERIRAGMREMLHVEGQHLRAGVGRSQQQAATAQWLLVIGTSVSVAIILAVFSLMRREVRRREATEASLSQLNARLEATVAERVRQLAAELEERRRTGELLEALAHQSALGIIALDPQRRVTLWNPAAEQIFGYAASEVVGQPYPIVPEDLRGEHDSYFKRFSSGEFLRDVEVERQRKDGRRIRTVFSGIALYGPARELRGVVFMCEDVTQRRVMEEQLRQAQKMEAIGQLTGGIAHDFNNLLLVILGSLELVEEDLAEQPELRHELQRAIRAGERGATLTRSLLAFSRKQPLSPTRVQVNRLVTEMVGLLGRTLGEQVEIKLVTGDNLWACDVDSGQLQNALLNLSINARDAMPSGGKLTIETRNAELDADYAARHTEVVPGEYVSVAVSDTGTGMPPDIVARVFEPFFTTKAVGKGNGLGLSMVFGFVKQSGGHIKVYSEVGVGTTIRMYLPRSYDAGEARGATAGSDGIVGGNERILVVEDDADVRGLTVRLLDALGYEVIEAASASEAIERLRDGTAIDLLLTDVILAGEMNGRQLADALAMSRPDLRVLFMSGYTETAILHHGRLDPGVELLQKPFRRKDLAAKVRRVLDRKTDAVT